MTAEPERRAAVSLDEALTALREGDVSVEGQIPWSSNTTFLASASHLDLVVSAVYKPRRGERPLWDFPPGTLYMREMAAFVVSEALAWHLVPPTAIRSAQYGVGALQLFVPHDPEDHYLALDEPDSTACRRIAAFDVVINNADRKAGHVLHAGDGSLWAIDHGVSFHEEDKLRTVIWEFAGSPVPDAIASDVAAFADRIEDGDWPARKALDQLLAPREIAAVAARARGLVDACRFPEPGDDWRSYPWPPV